MTSMLQSISPGVVKTEVFTDTQLDAMEKQNYPFLNPSDISNAILYVLGTPPHVQVGSHLCFACCQLMATQRP